MDESATVHANIICSDSGAVMFVMVTIGVIICAQCRLCMLFAATNGRGVQGPKAGPWRAIGRALAANVRNHGRMPRGTAAKGQRTQNLTLFRAEPSLGITLPLLTNMLKGGQGII